MILATLEIQNCQNNPKHTAPYLSNNPHQDFSEFQTSVPLNTLPTICVLFCLNRESRHHPKLVRYAKTQWPKIRTFGTPRKFSSYVSPVFHYVFPSFPSFSPSLVGFPTLETPPRAHAVCAVPLAPWPPVSPYGDPGA